jgi:hypothetical protein
MAIDTDYTITDTRRAPNGHVTYRFSDRYGQRYHLTVSYAHSVPAYVDPAIRRMIATHRPKRRTP